MSGARVDPHPIRPRIPLPGIPRRERQRQLSIERRARCSGAWGPWRTIRLPQGTGSTGWGDQMQWIHRNDAFAGLERRVIGSFIHLAISSCSGARPTWRESQRIKEELLGPTVTAIEVYPPKAEIVDAADMCHLWGLYHPLGFGLRE